MEVASRRVILSVLLWFPMALRAQGFTEVRLATPTAQLDAELSDVTTMRELSDGRVLLYDRKEDRLMVADLRSGTTRNISRRGQGPGEFTLIAALLPLAGDSTLAADLNRWLIIVGDSVAMTIPSDNAAIRAVSLFPWGADRHGHVLARRSAPPRDSAYVALVERGSGRTDTVARLAVGVRRAPSRAVTLPDGTKGQQISRIPLNVGEGALLFNDGWMAIVRLDPYRIDWRAPGGQWTRGAALPFPTIPMNERERQAYVLRNPWAQRAPDWPEVLPPFDTTPYGTFLASPDGSLVVRRLPSANQPENRYDVIDRRGALQAQRVLPTNQHILGFGRQSVYVITTDDDGIQRLSRHSWP